MLTQGWDRRRQLGPREDGSRLSCFCELPGALAAEDSQALTQHAHAVDHAGLVRRRGDAQLFAANFEQLHERGCTHERVGDGGPAIERLGGHNAAPEFGDDDLALQYGG